MSGRPRAKKPKPEEEEEEEIVVIDDDDDDYVPSKGKKGAKKRPSSASKPQSEEPAPSSKRPKKAPKAPKEAVERRCSESGKGVPFRPTCSQKVLERIERAMPGGHRMFLIDRHVTRPLGDPQGPAEEFSVLGATGNVYKVRVCKRNTCECPDHEKGNLCKHILFVLLRVLRLGPRNPLVWQTAYLTDEVERILTGQESAGAEAVGAGVMADETVRNAYRSATGAGPAAAAAAAAAPAGRNVESDCAVCMDPLGREKLATCGGCRNAIHHTCWAAWMGQRRAQRLEVTCPSCRGAFDVPLEGAGAAGGAAAAASPGKYLNLAQHSQAHRGADLRLEALYGADRAQWIGDAPGARRLARLNGH